MSEQLGIIIGGDQAKFAYLLMIAAQEITDQMREMLGVLVELIGCPFGMIVIFVGEVDVRTRDTPILHPTRARFFVEFTVVKVTGIPAIGTPHLHTSFVVASDHRHVR